MDLLNEKAYSPHIRNLTLKSSDGQTFQIDVGDIGHSKLLTQIIKDNQDENEFALPEVEGKTLKKIVEFLEHYQDRQPKRVPKPLKNGNLQGVLDPWDYEFIMGISIPDCIDLINAGNYMEVDAIVTLACIRLAAKMIDSPVDEVCNTFGIECDMNEEETNSFGKYTLSI